MLRLLAFLLLVSAAAAAQPADAGAPALKAVLTVKEGLATPESVFYDAQTDTYLVSNIFGAPLDKDNNGYVTELSPDGAVLHAKLIEGGVNKVTLNAPKGLAVHDGLLYVADIDTVRLFDRKTGAPKGEVRISGATFVNDLAEGPDGRIYVTDSGLDAKFGPTGTDGLYVIEPGKKPVLKTLVKGKNLERPNGLLVTADAIYMVTFGAADLFKFDLKGRQQGTPTKLPTGSLDGIIAVGDDFVISSWDGSALYRGKFGETFRLVAGDLKAPADIGYDSKRGRVLVPHFQDNFVEAFEVK